MDINILFIIVIAILGIGVIWGWKRGFLESVIRIISCILGILVLIVVAKGIGSFMQKSYVQVVMAFALLAAIRLIHKIMRFLTDSFKLVRAIPIGKLADKFAGAALGLAESVLIVWLGFLLLGVFDTLGLNAWVLEQVEQSRFITIMFKTKYQIALLQKVFILV